MNLLNLSRLLQLKSTFLRTSEIFFLKLCPICQDDAISLTIPIMTWTFLKFPDQKQNDCRYNKVCWVFKMTSTVVNKKRYVSLSFYQFIVFTIWPRWVNESLTVLMISVQRDGFSPIKTFKTLCSVICKIIINKTEIINKLTSRCITFQSSSHYYSNYWIDNTSTWF